MTMLSFTKPRMPRASTATRASCFPFATHSTGLAMKDLREAETYTSPALSASDRFGREFDRVFLGALVIGAILATAAFAYIVMRFVH
jgi:hypothetical protein